MTLVIFASRAVEPWNPVIQRVAVTLPLGAEVLLAVRLLTLRPSAGPTDRAALTGPH